MKHTRKFIVCLAVYFFLPGSFAYGQDVVINEFMPDNESVLQDQDGDYNDWIEIYNNGSESINLENYGLSDDNDELRKWLFPDVLVPPNGYMLVFASGKNKNNNDELHSNFKIAAEGEELILTDDQGMVIDQLRFEFLSADESFGRFPDGSSNWFKTYSSTPEASNNSINHLKFSEEGGFYDTPFSLNINSLMNDTVYYTLDGSIPDINSQVYNDSLFLDYKHNAPNFFCRIPTTPDQSLLSYKAWESPGDVVHKAHVVRCASFKNGVRTSRVYTHTFFIDQKIHSRYSMPVMSLVTDQENLFDDEQGIYVPGIHYDPSNPEWTGNYFQNGDEWERPVHITYFEEEGSKGFSQDAGMRMHGLKTRQAAQKSLRLYARKEYGDKDFNYPLLPQKEVNAYKRFILRSTMGDWWHNTVIRDVVAHEISRKLNLEYQDYRPVVVYLNGEYWGIYTLRDRIDERYISYTCGYDKDSVDIIEGNHRSVIAGTNADYISLAQFIEGNDLSQDDNYEHVKGKVDVDNLIDYYIAELFFANLDWPGNNQKLWKPQQPGGKWRWIFYDLDAGFGSPDTEMFSHAFSNAEGEWHEMPVSTFLVKNLLKNEKFVELFLQRFAEVLNTDFNAAAMAAKLVWIKELYKKEMPGHVARWHFPESVSAWEDDVQDRLMGFLMKRPCAIEKDIEEYFNLGDFGFDCKKSTSSSDSLLSNLKVGPNPNNGSFYLFNNSKEMVLDRIIITDLNGKIHWLENHVFLSQGERKHIHVNLPAGIYLLQYHNGRDAKTQKLVINP